MTSFQQWAWSIIHEESDFEEILKIEQVHQRIIVVNYNDGLITYIIDDDTSIRSDGTPEDVKKITKSSTFEPINLTKKFITR